jgi:hypothetical protein
METFYDCIAKAAIINQWTIGEVFDNWNSKEAEQIINKAADYYAETRNSHKYVVMQVPQFEQLLQVRLDELPYTKHLDDGQYNDGQVAGFEYGARWLYEKLSSGTTVGKAGGDASVSDGK